MGAVMFGNGVSGIGTNILRAATLKIFPADDDNNNMFIGALTTFMFAFVVLAACAIATLCLTKNKFAQYYLKRGTGVVEDDGITNAETERLNITGSASDVARQENGIGTTASSSKNSV